MQFKLFKCQICGDPYLGDEAPINCPFCGAKKELFVDGKDYVSPFTQEHGFTPQEKENFKAALDIEVGNASFYMAASTISEGDYYKSLFKALKKVEAEHAGIFAKHLGVTKPELLTIQASTNGEDNLEESHRREQVAIEAYMRFADEATTRRAKQVFSALVDIEKDHLSLNP